MAPKPLGQTLSYKSGGATDTLKAETIFTARSEGGVPALDLSMLKVMQNPHHRYNYSYRSQTHDERNALKESARNTYRPAISPAWLQHNRQALRFNAFFKEPVHEDPKENFRVRHCVIYFYLEDGTMSISEPKVENSGIPQGTFVKRHRIPNGRGDYYTFHDLRCGINLNVYARVFRITGCDDFTRDFYANALGGDVGEEEVPPLDAFHASQLLQASHQSTWTPEIAEGKEYAEVALGGNRRNTKLQQYLESDRKVLRFQCYWDDPTRYGSRMYYVLHYYLADNTVEMLERLARNSGRDTFPVFRRREVLLKRPHINPAPGMLEPEPEPVKPEDLIVGGTVEVYGRQVFLYDCDDFTRDFYGQYMQHRQGKIAIEKPEHVHVKLAAPPHIGLGTEEDSMASVLNLAPRQPRLDVNKLMSEDRSLRFEALIEGASEEDEDRRFVIQLRLADNYVGVWEMRQRNSGHTEGKFAQLSRKKNPATGKWFEPEDFRVGEIIEVNAVPFKLLKADESSKKTLNNLGLT
eukprot:CAMPEP_0170614838 /NCGR_PEP_ID=MMETSP0224-20130122/25017_1 /TAXON_ID=285029 /ORGANISM="Togula jolla, Strain CCCM 725" /LENGTH=521 /DNA_ID=CAMNT_0010940529 /DNA_START=115 /DNA_END=1680 /DNA_ORIENTATION=+